MKLKRALKIILSSICVFVTGFLIVLIYVLFYIENAPFEYSMLIPLFMIPAGVLSISYHFKTLKFYTRKRRLLMFKDLVLWVGNILFALSQILTSLYLSYSIYLIYQSNQNMELHIAYIICFIMLVFGFSLVVETYNLYKRILKNDNDLYKGTIDDIKGIEENQD